MTQFRVSEKSEGNPLLYWIAHQRVKDLERVSQILPRDPAGELSPKSAAILHAFTLKAMRAMTRARLTLPFQRSDAE